MAAIGKVSEKILEKASDKVNLNKNILVKTSTVNKLLDLVSSGKVDAAIVWGDAVVWKESKELKFIPIPEEVNEIKEVWVSHLAFTSNHHNSLKFFDYLKTKGIPIFKKNGFVQ